MSDVRRDQQPSPIRAALARLSDAHAVVCERTLECLALDEMSCTSDGLKISLQAAHAVLARHGERLQQVFGERLQEGVAAEDAAFRPEPTARTTRFPRLDGGERRHLRVLAEQFVAETGPACDWELRELDGYVTSWSEVDAAAPSGEAGARRHPLRPDTIAQALVEALDELPCDAPIRDLLARELTRSWRAVLPSAYKTIAGSLRSAAPGPANSRPAALRAAPPLAVRSSVASTAPSMSGPRTAPGTPGMPRDAGTSAARPADSSTGRIARSDDATTSPAAPPSRGAEFGTAAVRATAVPSEDRVMDVVGRLFENILADPTVPPHVARQIGRLQLPALRMALHDSSFFASSRHPARRLVNRIASLGASMDRLEAGAAEALVHEIGDRVQRVVDGAHDSPALYEAQLDRLEAFVAEQGRRAIDGHGAARLLAQREQELHTGQARQKRLLTDLQAVCEAGFVRDFLVETWAHVLLTAARSRGPHGDGLRALRHAGRELVLSVQPKCSSAERQAFLSRLPRLIQELNRGLDLIGWPASERHTFFGQLLPAQARSLDGEPGPAPDLTRRAVAIDAALERVTDETLADDVPPPTGPVPLETGHAPLLTREEADGAGLMSDVPVDWNGRPEPQPADDPPLASADLAIEGLPLPDAPEPTRGRALAHHLQIGVAYRMHLQGQWHKVRLNHISPGRTFFVFSRGQRHPQAISLTYRMIVRLCETGRLRAFETAYLLDRATARTRRQLAELRVTTTAG